MKWCKSSYSGQTGDCVEVASLDKGGRAVRDSKNPDGGMLSFTKGGWSAFLNGVRAGEFD